MRIPTPIENQNSVEGKPKQELNFSNIEISDIIRVNDSQLFDSTLHLKSSALIIVHSEQKND